MGLFGDILGGIGGLFGGGKAKKASRKAEAAQLEYLNRARAQQQSQFDVTRGDYAPALSLLAPSIDGLRNLTGLNGDEAFQAGLDDIRAGPLYQNLYRSGEEALLQNASATGGMRGGNMQTGLANFGADTLQQALLQQLSQYGGLAGLGMGATDSISNFGAMNSQNASNLLSNMGQVRAGGLLTRGGINSQMWNNIGSMAGNVANSGGRIGSFLGKIF